MPDVGRSDSQRSDTSVKPRVSFNRDVHVKRIVPARENPRVVGALSGDGTGRHFVASSVKKEKLSKNKKELEEEAAKVLHQADRIDCVTAKNGVYPEKFYSLPHRKKYKEQNFNSLGRGGKRKGSLELIAPKKPPRTFAAGSSPQGTQKTSIFDVFRKDKKTEPKKSNLKRSVSDASNLKSKAYGPDDQLHHKRSGSDTEDCGKSRKDKKQLSPIIEVAQREDYFQPSGQENKENIRYNDNIDVTSPERKKKKESVTEQLKKFIDEVDEELYKETGIRVTPTQEARKNPEPIIIDLDKAEKISTKSKKFRDTTLGKKLKSITHKKNKANDVSKIKKLPAKKIKETKPVTKEKQALIAPPLSPSPAPIIKAAIENLENSSKTSPTMLHSSQKPVEKLPLTKGRNVDHLVKRLSNDSSASPPPTKTNILIAPHGSIQHNNNQPFSYTRGLSPEKINDHIPNPGSPIIYAQVVCGSGGSGPGKQTVHTTFTNGKRHQHSDSDEGLGGEENSFGRIDKSTTHFGDTNRNYFDEVDKYEEESPITPKFRNSAYVNGYSSFEKKYNEFSKVEHVGYFDSSNRGRADGMDAKRRESLTEPQENGFGVKINGRSDVSARRDLLESRINRRMNDHSLRTSPEYLKNSSPTTNVYISETTSKYYRNGSTSPVGYKEHYKSETKTDKHGKPHTIEKRSKQYFGEPKERLEYDSRQKNNGYQYNGLDSEPKSFDSQISDYRSSPENRQLEASHRYNLRSENRTIFKDRDLYKSNPEIHLRSYQENRERDDSYHDSLRRENVESRVLSTKYRSDRYLEENERKEKFVDSGIENDFRRDSGRDSGDNYRTGRPISSRRDYLNESEDEGFASSLLIASERQHTEDSINHRRRDDKVRDYDSDKRDDDRYRNIENFEYRSKFRSSDYVPRERSIDDGSHYDPRIDKEIERSTLKRVEKKPPKPEKKTSLEKVKSLFTRDSKKKKEKQEQSGMVREESLRARYVEYKGKDLVEPRYKKKNTNDLQNSYDYNSRRRLSTPSPSPTRNGNLKSSGLQRNNKPTENGTHGSWFKSLDRLARKSIKKDDATTVTCSGTEDDTSSKPTPSKNLRFFGDTDLESNDDSIRHKIKTRTGWNRSQSSSYLNDIGEKEELGKRKPSHKSMTNVAASESDRDVKSSRSTLKPPISPSHRVPRDVSKQDRDRGRRRKNEVSSVESSTEGDSSQQSQRSIVYLHAATVGDIPGPGYIKNGRRAASREELVSNSSSRIQPQVKTLSRSFSVLAPWRPRHARENMDIDYTQYPKPQKNGKYEQKTSKSSSRKDSSSTLKKKAQESKKNQSSLTLNRKTKSKENLSSSQTLKRSREEISKGSSSTLYKKKERLPRENSRYSRDKEDRKIATKSLSVESLGNNPTNGRKSREGRRDISRSVSMPRDPEKSAGWFKMSKKSKMTNSTQRL